MKSRSNLYDCVDISDIPGRNFTVDIVNKSMEDKDFFVLYSAINKEGFNVLYQGGGSHAHGMQFDEAKQKWSTNNVIVSVDADRRL